MLPVKIDHIAKDDKTYINVNELLYVLLDEDPKRTITISELAIWLTRVKQLARSSNKK